MKLKILMNVLRDKMLMVNECSEEGRRRMEDVVSRAGPEGTLNAGQMETQCGGSVSEFSTQADYGAPDCT